MLHVVKAIIAGAICGSVTALLGYAKSSTAESFDWKKARQTMIIGAVIGGISGYFGWSYDKAEEWASNMGITTLIEYIKKAILRRLGKE